MKFTNFSHTWVGLLFAVATNAIGLDLFHDGDCQQQFAAVTVNDNTCATFTPGWSSMGINLYGPLEGSLSAYEVSNCAGAQGGSHGYHPRQSGCLKEFGFVANAVGLWAWPGTFCRSAGNETEQGITDDE